MGIENFKETPRLTEAEKLRKEINRLKENELGLKAGIVQGEIDAAEPNQSITNFIGNLTYSRKELIALQDLIQRKEEELAKLQQHE